MSSQLPEQLVQLLRGHRGLLQQGRKILGALVDVSRDRRSPGGNALEVARHVPDIREDLAGLPKQSGKAGLAVPDLTHDRADIGAGAFQLSQDPPTFWTPWLAVETAASRSRTKVSSPTTRPILPSPRSTRADISASE